MRKLLVVSLLIGCGDGASLDDAGNRAPVASLTGDTQDRIDRHVSFDASASYDPDGDRLTYAWSFGDGFTEPDGGARLTHAYANAGVYSVTVTVSDDEHESTDSLTISITANEPPVIVWAMPETIDAGSDLLLDVTQSYDPDGSIASFDWDLGDGRTAVGSRVNATWSTADTYSITVTVTDNDGGSSAITRRLRVDELVDYSGAWQWDLVNPDDVNDPNCGPFFNSELTIAIDGDAISVSEGSGLMSVDYAGTIDGNTFTVTNPMLLGGYQEIEATFVGPDRFEGIYYVTQSLSGCDRSRSVYGTRN